MTFFNPYHFFPIHEAKERSPLELKRSDAKAFRTDKNLKGNFHGVYKTDRHSGQITCTLTVKTPLVLGGNHGKSTDGFTVIKPFTYNNQLAIPATSLKGMIASIAEAASASAMRVLENKMLFQHPNTAKEEKKLSIDKVHNFVAKVDSELIPFHKNRKTITLAEKLFGFVEMQEGESQTRSPHRNALAGRVRFSYGKIDNWTKNDDYLTVKQDDKGNNYQKLKILASPKPPSPALYFKQKSGVNPVHKALLSTTNPEIQGRKHYLHQKNEEAPNIKGQWETKISINNLTKKELQNLKNQIVTANPIKQDTTFSFSVSFDNLSDAELNLLCFALKPSDEYWHKLGMGKPLGLGSVEITVENIKYVDRQSRYSEEDPFCFETDKTKIEEKRYQQKPCDFITRRDLHKTTWKAITPHALNAIILMGEKHDLESVYYPRYGANDTPEANQNGETDGFRWFVKRDNEGNNAAQLKPIDKDSPAIPSLKHNGQNE